MRPRHPTIAAVAVALSLAGAGAALGHDYWIQPGEYIVAPGARVAVHLFVGHGDELTEHQRRDHRTIRFELFGPDGKQAVPGRDNGKPAGVATLARPGVYTVVYQSNHSFIELPADRFVKYLAEEHLIAVEAERTLRGESAAPGRESYARYCKALIKAGAASDGWDRRVGLPVEIVALEDPFAARPEDELSFAVEVDGKPLASQYVELVSIDDLHRNVPGKTDKRGKVTFKVPAAGRWMVATTYMRRAPRDVKGDWESFWATLSFAVPR